MTIQKTNRIVYSIILLALIILTIAGFIAMDASNTVRLVERDRADVMMVAEEYRESSKDLTNLVRTYVVTGDEQFKQDYNNVVASRTGQIPRESTAAVHPNEKYDLIQLIRDYDTPSDVMKFIESAAAESSMLIQPETEAMNLIDNNGSQEEAFELVFGDSYHNHTVSIMQKVNDFLIKLEQYQSQLVDNELDKYNSGIIACLISLIFLVLAVCAAMYISSRKIINPLVVTRDFSHKISAGDFNTPPPPHGDDEIGQLNDDLTKMVQALKIKMQESNEQARTAQKMSTELQSTLGSIQETRNIEQQRSEHISQMSSELAGVVHIANQETQALAKQIAGASKGSSNIYHRIADVTSAMSEMNIAVTEVAHNASEAVVVAASAKEKAEQGANTVGDAVTCINSIEQQAVQVRTDMLMLEQQADSIGSIMNVISDIADQTNLLALNAAIEAARAGEAGRGFAVVADEVRKLAEKTMVATVEVGSAIKSVQTGVESNMKNVDATTEGISTVTTLIRDAGRALEEIVQLVESSADQARVISTAAEEQSQTSDHINNVLVDVSQLAEQSAQAMEDSAVSVNSQAEQVHKLTEFVTEMQRI